MKKNLSKKQIIKDTRELIKTYNTSIPTLQKIKCPSGLTAALNILTEGEIQFNQKLTFTMLKEFIDDETERIGIDNLTAKVNQCYVSVKLELYKLTFLKYTEKELLLLGSQALMLIHFSDQYHPGHILPIDTE